MSNTQNLSSSKNEYQLSVLKAKKFNEQKKLKDFENDLDELCKRKKLKRGPLNEYEKNLIVERQW